MNIFITGSRGFIGSELARALTNLSNYKVSEIDTIFLESGTRNIANSAKVVTYHRSNMISRLESIAPDVIFHLAATPLVGFADTDILLDKNVLLTYNILRAISKTGRKDIHVIFASSATVYGDGKGWVSEEYATIPSSAYGCTKLASENLINAYALNRRINATILRLVANVGPNPTHGVVKDLVYKYRHNDILEVLGTYPGSRKPYMHVYDTINAMTFTMWEKLYGTYNVSQHNGITVSQIVDAIEKRFKQEKEVKWLGDESLWRGDNKVVSVNSSKLREAGWRLRFSESLEAVNEAVKEC